MPPNFVTLFPVRFHARTQNESPVKRVIIGLCWVLVIQSTFEWRQSKIFESSTRLFRKTLPSLQIVTQKKKKRSKKPGSRLGQLYITQVLSPGAPRDTTTVLASSRQVRVKTTQVSVSIASYSRQAIFDEGKFYWYGSQFPPPLTTNSF